MIAQSTNRLLAALPADEYRRLMPELHTIHLQDGDTFPHCGAARVYFPERGFCSVRRVMPDGRAIEIVSVGNEGVIGLAALSGAPDVPGNTYVQVTHGTARFMLLDSVNRELARPGTLRRLVERFSRSLLESIIQSAACNGRHTAEHRCVRWLLMAQDRIGAPQFELTAQSLAYAVGFKKTKVAMVLKQLSRQNVVDTTGGMMTIVDREGLARRACSCYGRMKRQREDGLPAGRATGGPAGRATVIQLVPDVTCPRCQSAANLPHASEHECILGIDAEMRLLITRTAKLHALRKVLVEERLRVMRGYLNNARSQRS